MWSIHTEIFLFVKELSVTSHLIKKLIFWIVWLLLEGGGNMYTVNNVCINASVRRSFHKLFRRKIAFMWQSRRNVFLPFHNSFVYLRFGNLIRGTIERTKNISLSHKSCSRGLLFELFRRSEVIGQSKQTDFFQRYDKHKLENARLRERPFRF